MFAHSMLFKAQDKGLAQFQLINLRDFGQGPRKTVDDSPYGGGDGMLLKVEPLHKAIDFAKNSNPDAKVILMTPRGQKYMQSQAREFSTESGLIIVCGRYEGYDERVAQFIDQSVSIGNYVLTGGEIPAMVLVDSVTRLIPGVLGGATSAEIESFADDITIEYPQYTRPEEYEGLKVPEVLLSGNHQAVESWRSQQSQLITKQLNS